MKKVAMAASVAALSVSFLAMSQSAGAQEVNGVKGQLKLGGFLSTAYVNQKYKTSVYAPTSYRKNAILVNNEVFFQASGNLAGGSTIGAKLELETAQTSGDRFDEMYFWISNPDAGKIQVGSTNLAASKLQVGFVGGLPGFEEEGQLAPAAVSDEDVDPTIGIANDSEHVAYYTPNLFGVELGIAYAPNGGSQDQQYFTNLTDANITTRDLMSLGIKYAGEFEGVSVAASAGYEMAKASDGASKPKQYAVGAEVGAYGASLGGIFLKRKNSVPAGAASVTNTEWRVGAEYSWTDWTFGVHHGRVKKTNSGTGGGADKTTQTGVSAAYEGLGPGVTLWAGVLLHDHEDGNVQDNKGHSFLLGTKLSF